MKITASLLVLFAFTTGAFAQDSSAKLQLARDVIGAMQADKMFDGMVAQMKQMAAQITSRPDATPEQRQKDEALQGKLMEISMGGVKGLLSKMDQIYADVYTEAELKAMKSFYSSTEGKSMVAKQPAVMAHVMPLVQEMQREIEPKIKKLLEESAAAK